MTETLDNLSLIKQQNISSLVTIIVSFENSNFLAHFASEMEDVESPWKVSNVSRNDLPIT